MKMDGDNIILDKTFAFAVRIVNLYKYLTIKSDNKEYVLSKQLLRSGTSIGANTEEAIGAASTADFVNKLSIAYKEARETKYWIRLLHKTEYLSEFEANSILTDLDDICNILAKIQITTRGKTTPEK
ncbi:MAG: four helix bundle protein [Paludibacteraceae bacterium]|nr:four helix bundle protein [Paludibacteraceae bacterium]